MGPLRQHHLPCRPFTGRLAWSISSRFIFISLVLTDSEFGNSQIREQRHPGLLHYPLGATDLTAVDDHQIGNNFGGLDEAGWPVESGPAPAGSSGTAQSLFPRRTRLAFFFEWNQLSARAAKIIPPEIGGNAEDDSSTLSAF
jgi:hypothetical protein